MIDSNQVDVHRVPIESLPGIPVPGRSAIHHPPSNAGNDMPYTLSIEDLDSISDAEMAFSTMRLLPPMVEIPDDFLKGNLYTNLAESIFFGTKAQATSIELKEGVDPEKLNRCVRAHLQSFGPKHGHKIAGVGYMISLMAELS